MTELALPSDRPVADLQPYQDANLARLAQWAQQADAAVRMADVIANTSMCPQAYRGKTNEAAAAILAGAEVGLSPMAALRAFDNIQGTPAPKALTLRAIVQALGHEVNIVHSDEHQAEVAGRRKGSDQWQVSVWTIQRADQMGLTGKTQWKQQPAAMLVARATAEVCRWIASDAIMGMPYAAEEIVDTGLHAAPPTARVTAADIVGAAVEHVEQTEMATRQQRQDIAELLLNRGISDAETALPIISEAAGRTVHASAELTSNEAEKVIANLAGGAA